MSTNYYAVIESGTPFDDAVSTRTVLHIGKFSGSALILNGTRFKTWDEWRVFLEFSGARVVTEYKTPTAVEEFIHAVEATSRENRRKQFDMVQEFTLGQSRTWLDDNGYTMSEGTWS